MSENVAGVYCLTDGCAEVFPVLEALEGPPFDPCPQCGSMKRKIMLTFSDLVEKQVDSFEVRTIPGGRGRSAFRLRHSEGTEWSKGLKRLVDKISIFDRDNDRRYELVIDHETREVIHRQDHPLSEHRGHGTDKPEQES